MKARALFDLDGFESFWQFYPRKENKLQARKAWAKLKPVPDAMKLEAIRTWVEAASMSEQWRDPRFIPHASTVINQRRWESDPPPRRKPQAGENHWTGPSWTVEEVAAILAERRKVEEAYVTRPVRRS